MDERSFLLNRETAVSYLNSLHHVFVFDGFANWDIDARIKVSSCSRKRGWSHAICSESTFYAVEAAACVVHCLTLYIAQWPACMSIQPGNRGCTKPISAVC
jgi:hypothetical protein